MPNEIEIHDVALAVWVRNAETCLALTGDLAQCRPEILGVSASDSNGGKYPCFVTATRMLCIQAVILELTDIDNGPVAIGQSHESSIVNLSGNSPLSFPIMPRFQTVVRRARFTYSPFTAQEMQGFAQLLADTIRKRIQNGQNIYDQAAAPLKPAKAGRRGYPDYKAAHGLQPIRDWTWTGHTMRCLKVLTATENRAVIGFLDEALPGRSQTASQLAFWNNQTERMWGVSPADRDKVIPLIYNYRPVVTLQQVQGAGSAGSTFRSFQSFGSTYFGSMRQAGFAQYIGAKAA